MNELILEVHIQMDDGSVARLSDMAELKNRLLSIGAEKATFDDVDNSTEGAKSSELINFASVTLVLLPILVPEIIKFLRTWAGLDKDRRVRIRKKVSNREVEIEYNIEDVSNDEIRAILDGITVEIKKG